MKSKTIFPSCSDKVRTVAIFSFIAGLIISCFVMKNINFSGTVLTTLTTLFAAFLGAWSAYKLEDNKKKRELVEKDIANTNKILFVLYETQMFLIEFKNENIVPHRTSSSSYISIPPSIDMKESKKNIEVESLFFLLETEHRQILLDLHEFREAYYTSRTLINERSELLFTAQKSLQSSNLKQGVPYNEQDYIKAIGDKDYSHLKQLTKGMIFKIEEAIVHSELVRKNLIKAVKASYPNSKLIDITFQIDKTN